MVHLCIGRLCYLREPLPFPPELCRRRFLILDPRVNRLHNQIISSELGIFLARAWGRVLLLPGFFFLPSADPDSGDWARVGQLFDLQRLRRCHEVYELQEALQVCGETVVAGDMVLWPMTVPWDRGYRTDIKVEVPRRGTLTLTPRVVWEPLDLGNPPMTFPAHIAKLDPVLDGTRTILVHGCFVLDPPRAVLGHTCFVPSKHLEEKAAAILSPSEAHDCVALHWRWFNETDDYQHYWDSCKLTASAAASVLRDTGASCWWVISDAPLSAVEELRALLPGVQVTGGATDVGGVAVSEASALLRAVIVDDAIAAGAGAFIGNPCSTMSSYIMRLRLQGGKPPGAMHHRRHVDLKLRDTAT
mmetsp:Transcript_54972/g.118040  ORF Transcript_54972/g.118040 Transcript_54972/m.118040 type:complete len:359 (+) Transcript_54972:33-1109(+)